MCEEVAMDSRLSLTELADLLSLPKETLRSQAVREAWKCDRALNSKGGGDVMLFHPWHLPVEYQRVIVQKSVVSQDIIPRLAPEAGLLAVEKLMDMHAQPSAPIPSGFSMDAIKDERFRKSAEIALKAQTVPEGWKASKWVEAVATQFGVNRATVYREIARYKSGGFAGFQRTRKTTYSKWSSEALDFWHGLVIAYFG